MDSSSTTTTITTTSVCRGAFLIRLLFPPPQTTRSTSRLKTQPFNLGYSIDRSIDTWIIFIITSLYTCLRDLRRRQRHKRVGRGNKHNHSIAMAFSKFFFSMRGRITLFFIARLAKAKAKATVKETKTPLWAIKRRMKVGRIEGLMGLTCT